ncbi:DUF4112 domain-containing protein [Allohahella marinimesophila]|uniref:DUF4112 domain-containing protein n=1 Tax=Allohahella marinimesophila TaxID=1054972 RepID=A0ABP7Q5V4_9GAMM
MKSDEHAQGVYEARDDSPNANPGVVTRILNQSRINARFRNDEAAQRELLNHLNRVADTLDSQFRVPGIGLRFGWDSIIGVVPVVGDIAGAGLSLYLVARAIQIGASGEIIRKMLRNLLIEVAGGAVPIVGDAFDLVYKANNRNMRLLTNYLEAKLNPPPEPKRGWKALIVPGLAIALIIGFSWFLMRVT